MRSDIGSGSVCRVSDAASWKQTLQAQLDALELAGMSSRPWMYWEWHNPFSRAAAVVDSWQILDICQAPALLRHLVDRLGPDIVLFDSQIVPNAALCKRTQLEWPSDDTFFPLTEQRGAVVRIPLGATSWGRTETDAGRHQETGVEPHDILIHSPARQRDEPAAPSEDGPEFVVRYFPADLQYIRDPAHPIQDGLTRRFPWVNYATMPLWLVSGEDTADNDFVTGLLKRSGRWTTARQSD